MHTFRAMNTRFLLEGFPDEYSLEIQKLVTHYENIFSRFNQSSELSILNGRNLPGRKYKPEMINCIEEAVQLYKITKGLFNPFIGSNMKYIGYDCSFEKMPEIRDLKSTQVNLNGKYSSDVIPIKIGKDHETLTLAENVQIDLGGFAKGWTAERLKLKAKNEGYTNGLIDAGGDITAWGSHPNGHSWLIGVADPFNQNQDAFDIFLGESVSVATSSILKRRWKVSGDSYNNHIIDPRTGISTTSDIVQASVFSENLGISEAFTKVIIIEGMSGINKYTELFEENGIGYIAFTKSGDVLKNNILQRYIIKGAF